MKTAGVIGGFGPEATAKFQLKVVELCRAQKQISRPPLFIWHTPITLKFEEDLLIHSKNVTKFLPFLLEAAKKLERSGVDFIVFPCNTLHIFIGKIRKSVKVPVLNIIDETAHFLKSQNIKKIGILATQETIRRKLHTASFQKFQIKPVLPSAGDQRKIDFLINQIIAGSRNKQIKKNLTQISHKFIRNGVKDVLLACTDLQLVFPKIANTRVHDSLQILAQATVREILN